MSKQFINNSSGLDVTVACEIDALTIGHNPATAGGNILQANAAGSTFDGANFTFINMPPVGGQTLATLTDVNLTAPANHQPLAFDSVTSKWINSPQQVPVASQQVYVGMGGADSANPNSGTMDYPYLTVQFAMASILDASPAKLYQINVGPGVYAGAAMSLKPNVLICGAASCNIGVTKLDMDLNVNDPGWTGVANNGSGLCHVEINSAVMAIDFASIGAVNGVFFFQGAHINSVWSATQSSATSQIVLKDSICNAALTIIGGNFFSFGSQVFATMTVNDSLLATTNVDMIGSFANGYVSSFSGLGMAMSASIESSPLAALNLTGVQTFDATVDSLPTASQITLGGGAVITPLNECINELYVPAVVGDWSPVPADPSAALDQLAARSSGLIAGQGPLITSTLVGLAAATANCQYQKVGNIVYENLNIAATVSAIPSGLCSFRCSLITPRTVSGNFVTNQDLTGSLTIYSLNAGVIDFADTNFAAVESIPATQLCLITLSVGAAATAATLVLYGSCAYSV